MFYILYFLQSMKGYKKIKIKSIQNFLTNICLEFRKTKS